MTNETSFPKVREFDRKHGPERYSDGTFYHYPDGSLRDVDPQGLLLAADSLDLANPEQEDQLRRNQLRYHQLKLQSAVDAFDELNATLASSASIGESELRELRRLQGLVEERRKLATKAEEALAATQKGRQRQIFRDGQKQEAARVAEFQQKRRAIRI